MKIFLRNTLNEDVAEVDVFLTEVTNMVDLNVYIDIRRYSNILFVNEKISDNVISDFTIISKLRQWVHEYYFANNTNNKTELTSVTKILTTFLSTIADKYKLKVITG